jgi:hypothetical protein
MRCEKCGIGLSSGANFHRQNEKGVPGVWRCGGCNTKPVPAIVLRIFRALGPLGAPRLAEKQHLSTYSGKPVLKN